MAMPNSLRYPIYLNLINNVVDIVVFLGLKELYSYYITVILQYKCASRVELQLKIISFQNYENFIFIMDTVVKWTFQQIRSLQ